MSKAPALLAALLEEVKDQVGALLPAPEPAPEDSVGRRPGAVATAGADDTAFLVKTSTLIRGRLA